MSAAVATITGTMTVPTISGAVSLIGNVTAGDADTDTLTIRSLVAGGNSRAVWIADSAPTPTYAVGATDLYVKRYIESAGGMYAPFFDSVLTAGNVGYLRIKEDPTYGQNFRAWSVASQLDQDITFTLPNGNHAADTMMVFGAPAGNVSTVAFNTLSAYMDTVIGNTPGYVAKRGASVWVAAAETATGIGEDGDVQFVVSGAITGTSFLQYTVASNTLTTGTFSGKFIGNITGNVTGNASGYAGSLAVTSQTVGDLFYASSSTAVTILADVAAGQPLLSGGTTTAPGYAGYTFSGTALQTYTFPSATASLAPLDSPTFTTYLKLPVAGTTDAAGKIAIRTGAGAASRSAISTEMLLLALS